MRIDPDTCRDPVILSAEVRRLQAVIAAGEPTLTDAEREAIYRASQYLSQNDVFEGMAEDAATLRGLLERLGGGR